MHAVVAEPDRDVRTRQWLHESDEWAHVQRAIVAPDGRERSSDSWAITDDFSTSMQAACRRPVNRLSLAG